MSARQLLNNKGITLVEMMMVIAISVVLVGLAGLSLSLINNANTEKSAKALRAVIIKARNEAMARGPEAGTLVINDSVSGLSSTVSLNSAELVGRRGMQVYYYEGTGVAGPNGNEPVMHISAMQNFPSAGKTFKFNTAGFVTHVDGALVSGTNIYQIAFKKSNRVDCVVLYASTGNTEFISWYE